MDVFNKPEETTIAGFFPQNMTYHRQGQDTDNEEQEEGKQGICFFGKIEIGPKKGNDTAYSHTHHNLNEHHNRARCVRNILEPL